MAASTTPSSHTMTVELRGRTLHVSYSHREGQDETLLYFHGLGSAKSDFFGAWKSPLLKQYTLVAFDAPGCGETGGYHLALPLGMDDVVQVATELADRLNLNAITVVGQSFGGLGALLFTLRNTERVKRLVSVEGNLGPEDCFYSRRVFQHRFLGREEEYMNDLKAELLDSGWTGFDEFASVFQSCVDYRAFFDYSRSIVHYSDNFPLRDNFIALELPKLYIHGSENGHLSHIPVFVSEGVPVCSIPNSNHFPAHSNPEAFYTAIASFVQGTFI